MLTSDQPNPYALYAPKSDSLNEEAKKATKDAKDHADKLWKKANHRRWLFELKWLRNVLFEFGIQWIRINRQSQNVENLKLPPAFPRAITNKYSKVQDDLTSAVVQGDVPLNYLPAKDDPEALSTADISERLREEIDVEIDVVDLKRDLAFWFVQTGNAAIVPYYDYDAEYGTKTVPQYTCTNPGCDAGQQPGQPYQTLDATKSCPCGGPPPAPPLIAPDGVTALPQPQPEPYQQTGTVDLPIGKLCFDVLSPFELYQDNTVRIGSGKQRWFIRPRVYEVGKAKELWPEYADKITENMPSTYKMSRNFLLAVAYAGSYLGDSASIVSMGTGAESLQNQVIAWELHELPCEKYPQGVRMVLLGEYVVELEPLKPVFTAGPMKGKPYLPLVQFFQKAVGGAWGKARADDLVALQYRRNIIESNLQLTAQRTGAPKLLIPYGSGVKNVTGEAGQYLEYKPIGMGGNTPSEPHYLEAALGNVSPLLALLKMLDDQMEQIAGTFFLAGGDAPNGITAASALSYLGERSNRAIAPVKEQWANGWRKAYAIGIELIRQHWTDERTLSFLGANKQWQFQKFKAADIQGAVDVRVDYEALFPKAQSTIRADIMQLGELGLIDPSDPEQQFRIYEAMGQTGLKKSTDEAISQAMREWDAFLNNDVQPVLLPMVQNAPIHLAQHQLDAQTQEFEDLYRTNQQKADIWIAHIQATAFAIQTAQAASAPAPPPEHGKAGHPGSQNGAQNGSANKLEDSGPVKKGAAAADAEAQPQPATVG